MSDCSIDTCTVTTHRQLLAAISCVVLPASIALDSNLHRHGLAAEADRSSRRAARRSGGTGRLIREHPLPVGVAMPVGGLRQRCASRQHQREQRRHDYPAGCEQARAHALVFATRLASAVASAAAGGDHRLVAPGRAGHPPDRRCSRPGCRRCRRRQPPRIHHAVVLIAGVLARVLLLLLSRGARLVVGGLPLGALGVLGLQQLLLLGEAGGFGRVRPVRRARWSWEQSWWCRGRNRPRGHRRRRTCRPPGRAACCSRRRGRRAARRALRCGSGMHGSPANAAQDLLRDN